MDDQERGAARSTDPKTSHDAAEALRPARLHRIIVETLAEARTGLITHEIADINRIGYQTITPRMTALVDKGLVYDTGATRVWAGSIRSPATNTPSIIWQLTRLCEGPVPVRIAPRPIKRKREKVTIEITTEDLADILQDAKGETTRVQLKTTDGDTVWLRVLSPRPRAKRAPRAQEPPPPTEMPQTQTA